MSHTVQYLFAEVRRVSEFRPEVTAIVLFGAEVQGENPMYLEIRFFDYETLDIEGDHLTESLEEAMKYAEIEFGILHDDWRPMNEEEIERIPIN
ncbi:hypothetical protein [Pseudomonas sp. ENNP23]|uniref:hypothetical protein n=1 Tax=Pseudomonas sp. ENNP23 TaxID=1535636 RepID=UPI001C484270|nr:hypothetical protein [Pseudomonas sp. ENNP23]